MKTNKLSTIFLMIILFLMLGCPGITRSDGQPLDSRLSSAVALVYENMPISEFLANPGLSFVQAYVRFDSDLPEDVIFGIDQEFLDGVNNPLYVAGGDWMSFIGVQRNGSVWVARGSDATMSGVPSSDRSWQIFDLGSPLNPNTWYRLRVEADFNTRHFRRFTVMGPDITVSIDLSGLKLDYPNYMPFSGRAMSFYVFAMRGRGLINPVSPFQGRPVVYFDDVTGGPLAHDDTETLAFENGFEDSYEIGNQPVISNPIDLTGYVQGRWYLERNESLFSRMRALFARSGLYVGVADASID